MYYSLMCLFVSELEMKIYNLDYNVGGHSHINLDVELDITLDHQT